MIEVVGLASGSSRFLTYDKSDLSVNLLLYLRAQNIMIASSCSGEGVCKKCVIQNDWLSCMLTVEEFLKIQPDRKIFVNYL
jgi:hypothetical protein